MSTNNGGMSYPLDRLDSCHQQIRTKAQSLLDQHDQIWKQVKSSINEFPSFMYDAIYDALNDYQTLVRTSYQTQIRFADWLELAHTEMKKCDDDIATTFDNYLKSHYVK